MGRAPDFIGLGAQKAGTSWLYACLYEHPQICAPVKEIHFFSRQRNWPKGYAWYEDIFEPCLSQSSLHTKAGEFCTSYLSDGATPERIYARYPDVKLIVSLRHPADRAFSNYMNDIKSGTINRNTPFWEALNQHPEYVEQGRYASHLQRYLEYFPKEQLLILFFDDMQKNPLAFISEVYQFIGVDASFVPSMLTTKVNVRRVPKFLWLEKLLLRSADLLSQSEFRKVWWLAKKSGMGDKIRAFNSRQVPSRQELKPAERQMIVEMLKDELIALQELTGRVLKEWHL